MVKQGRPIAKRSAKALERDVKTILRLRTSIRRDPTISIEETDVVTEALDKAVGVLRRIMIARQGGSVAA